MIVLYCKECDIEIFPLIFVHPKGAVCPGCGSKDEKLEMRFKDEKELEKDD